MRRVGKDGRAMVKSFSYPKSKDELMEEIDKIARREGVFFSDIVIECLEDYCKKHGKSQNPQTEITLFETGLESAIPNLYQVNEDNVKSFYNKIKKKDEYKFLDEKLNIFLRFHNKKLGEFS